MKIKLFILIILCTFCCATCRNSHKGHHRQTADTNAAAADTSAMHKILDTMSKSKAKDCDPDLWEHIYNKDRLQVIDKCIIVTGTVEKTRHEPDGDEHIRLKLDAGQEKLINDKNITEQQGCMVVEIIYAHEPVQPGTIANYRGYTNHIEIPKVGQHIMIQGSYVKDLHHGWMEIHPVTSITVIH